MLVPFTGPGGAGGSLVVGWSVPQGDGWLEDPDIKAWAEWMKVAMPGADLSDTLNLAGYAYALTLEQVRNTHDLDTVTPLSREDEARLHARYGYPHWRTGSGLWGMAELPLGAMPPAEEAAPVGAALARSGLSRVVRTVWRASPSPLGASGGLPYAFAGRPRRIPSSPRPWRTGKALRTERRNQELKRFLNNSDLAM